MREYDITTLAAFDIVSILEYIKNDNIEASVHQGNIIYEAIERITEFPSIGKPIERKSICDKEYRYLSVNKLYVIVYSVAEDTITIARVFKKGQDFLTALGIE